MAVDENPYRSPQSDDARPNSMWFSLAAAAVPRAILVAMAVSYLITIVSQLMLIDSAPHSLKIVVLMFNLIISTSAALWVCINATRQRTGDA